MMLVYFITSTAATNNSGERKCWQNDMQKQTLSLDGAIIHNLVLVTAETIENEAWVKEKTSKD